MNNHGYSIIMSTFRINTTSETIGDRKYFRGYKLTALSADIPADQPTTPVTNHVHKHDDNDICVVCHCEMTSTEEIIVTECNHTFHKDCLMQWYNHRFNCPMCRKGLYNHHPEAQRLVKDNLLLHNLYMLIRILHFNVPLKNNPITMCSNVQQTFPFLSLPCRVPPLSCEILRNSNIRFLPFFTSMSMN